MFLSIEDLRLLITALDTLELEFGSPKAVALAERLRDARLAEMEAAR